MEKYKTMEHFLSRLEKYILYAVVFLFPVTVLTISPNPFVVPKLAVLTYGIALLLLIRAVRVIASGRLDFSVGNFDFPVLLFALAYLLSALFRTPNKMEAFLLPGTGTAVIAGSLLYFLINQLKQEEKSVITLILSASATLFSTLTLLSFSGVLAKVPQLPSFFKLQGFTPEGGYLPAAMFLGIILPIVIGHVLAEKEASKKTFFGVATGILVFGLAVSVYNLLPGRQFSPRFPSYSVSWYVAVDALKESPIFGVGPGNYITAFNRFRPLSYNTTDLWAVKFATARSFYMTALTEAGLIALAAMLFFFMTLYRSSKKDFKEKKLVNWGFAAIASMVALVALTLALLFLPATILLIVLLFVLLALNAKIRHTTLSLTTQAVAPTQGLNTQNVASRFPAPLITVPVIILVLLFFLRATTVLRAEYKFKKALDKLAANDAAGTYDTMREAISLNPRVDRYHATFSRVNLALANAITLQLTQTQQGQETEDGTKPTITDSDRQNITLLIQQAISEGKATVALNPLRAGNWEVLAQIYRTIMPLAQGADTFAIQTYRQAIALDPFNPNLRIALGGIYYGLKDYDNAIRAFESAVAAKNDHANAHYNLAFALRDKGDLDRALSEMSLVVSLIPDKNSEDYKAAQQALQDLQALRQAQGGPKEAPAGGGLTPPQKAGEPVLQPPLNLPEGSEPPSAPISPTPTPVAQTEGGLPISPTPTLSQ